jgi:hypothetical protein
MRSDLPLEGRALLLELVDLLLDGLQLALALLGGDDLAVQLADLARHVEVQGQAHEDGPPANTVSRRYACTEPGVEGTPAEDFFFFVGRSAAIKLIRIIGRPPFGQPDPPRWRR